MIFQTDYMPYMTHHTDTDCLAQILLVVLFALRARGFYTHTMSIHGPNQGALHKAVGGVPALARQAVVALLTTTPPPLDSNRVRATVSSHPQEDIPKVPPPQKGTQGTHDTKQNKKKQTMVYTQKYQPP